MKNLISFLSFLLFIGIQGQVDTAQIKVSNRVNSEEARNKPYVILISADGFRYDYLKKYNAQNLQNFEKNGVAAKAMIPSFPTLTFPNHWTMVTGLYPAHHGLIDNSFYDYKRKNLYTNSKKENAEDGSWYGGIPLWTLAEKQGMLSAAMMWVGSASDAAGIRPTYYYHYHQKFSPKEKVTKVLNWLKFPEEERPHFIALYFPEVDAAGHDHGPDSKETEEAVHKIDASIKYLVEKVKILGIKNVNFIFVSDHGMVKIDKENPLEIPEILFDKNRFDFYNAQTLLRVVVKNPEEVKSVFRKLKKNKSKDYHVFLTKKFPCKLNYSQKEDRYGRIGQIVLVPKAPKIFLEKGKYTSLGKHGYNPYQVSEMKATFLAFGEAFKIGKTIGEFKNVNIYPIIAEILDLKIVQEIDGKDCTARKILK